MMFRMFGSWCVDKHLTLILQGHWIARCVTSSDIDFEELLTLTKWNIQQTTNENMKTNTLNFDVQIRSNTASKSERTAQRIFIYHIVCIIRNRFTRKKPKKESLNGSDVIARSQTVSGFNLELASVWFMLVELAYFINSISGFSWKTASPQCFSPSVTWH